MPTTQPRRLLVVLGIGALTALFPGAANAQPSDGRTIYAVTSGGNRLMSFPANNPAAATTVTTTGVISGLGAGELVVGTDFRPSNNQLYALTIGQTSGSGSSTLGTGRIYTVNKSTAVATLVSTVSVQLAGSFFDIGFDPATDSLRIVSSTGQNLRVTGAGLSTTVTDTPLSYASGDANAGKTPRIAAVDYTPGGTGLYDLDSSIDTLALQGTSSSANAGSLHSIGTTGLGVNVTNLLGFDIEQDGTAYMSAQLVDPSDDSVSPTSSLFTVNLATGKATLIGTDAEDLFDSISIDTTPLPGPPTSLPEFPLTALAPVGALGVVVLVRRLRRT